MDTFSIVGGGSFTGAITRSYPLGGMDVTYSYGSYPSVGCVVTNKYIEGGYRVSNIHGEVISLTKSPSFFSPAKPKKSKKSTFWDDNWLK
jgi:hypothetical protein